MKRLRVVVLEHVSGSERHVDLFIEDPASVALKPVLWGGRIVAGPAAWRTRRVLQLHELERHRRRYLHFQGDIGGGRGVVRRLDRGWAVAPRWSVVHRKLALHLRGYRGAVTMHRIADRRWKLTFEAASCLGTWRGIP